MDNEQNFEEMYHKLKKKIKLVDKEQQEEEKKKQLQKSIKYLLAQSLQFSNFFKEKLDKHLQFTEAADFDDDNSKETENQLLSSSSLNAMQKLNFFEGGTLKPYQIEGLTWMIILFENGVSGILADEMGLGKTVQVIALICHHYEMHVDGPYLIVVPLSTLPNWVSEFKRFSPKIPVIVLYGNREERFQIQRQINRRYNLNGRMVKPVIITTYDIALITLPFLRQQFYQYLIIDEGHKLKNHKSKISVELRTIKSTNKLLLTGTPLQNNMAELWSLLNFILPDIFKDLETFSSFVLMEDIEGKKIEATNLISTLHKILAPFMLRRKKVDVLDLVPKKEVLVYCPMSELQRSLYMHILEKNISKLKNPFGNIEEEEAEEENYEGLSERKRRKCTQNPNKKYYFHDDISDSEETIVIEEPSSASKKQEFKNSFICRLTMQNTTMMFKKVTSHPYLVHFPLNPNSPEKQLLVDEQLVTHSGKMLVLDAMLSKLHANGNKIIIFTTLVMTLHLVEEFLLMRKYNYRQLTGNLDLDTRRAYIDEFNNDPNVFIFLCSTRAGGLGINLTSADTVIFFDRDWNPQVDLQAQDRCHRIGQTKPVMIYTLVTKNTVDDRIINCANLKRKLEKVVIKDGKFKNVVNKKLVPDFDFEELQKLLESDDVTHKIHANGFVFTDEELNALLDRTELYNQIK